MQKQSHKTMLEVMAYLAMAFKRTSSRSGAMMGGSFTPQYHGSQYVGMPSMKGRIKHAGETRRIRKAQRRRTYLRR